MKLSDLSWLHVLTSWPAILSMDTFLVVIWDFGKLVLFLSLLVGISLCPELR